MKFTPRPMHESLAHRSQRHVEPLLRPLPTPTRNVSVRPYLHPAIDWTPEVPPAPTLTPAERAVVTSKQYAAVRAAKGIVAPAPVLPARECSDTRRGPGCGVLFTPRHPRTKRCPACALIVAPRLTTRSVIERSRRRHPRYQSPEMTFGGQA